MLAPGRSRLAGLVEVDETEIACRRKNDPVTGGRGRSHQSKMLIVGAVEVEDGGRGPGRIRLSQVADCLLGRSPTAPDCGWRGSSGQFHARKWSNNGMALSRKEWLWSPNGAEVGVTSGDAAVKTGWSP